MISVYFVGSKALNRYMSKPEYKDNVFMLKTRKGKKPLSRIVTMTKYVKNHKSEEDLWFERWGLVKPKIESYLKVA